MRLFRGTPGAETVPLPRPQHLLKLLQLQSLEYLNPQPGTVLDHLIDAGGSLFNNGSCNLPKNVQALKLRRLAPVITALVVSPSMVVKQSLVQAE